MISDLPYVVLDKTEGLIKGVLRTFAFGLIGTMGGVGYGLVELSQRRDDDDNDKDEDEDEDEDDEEKATAKAEKQREAKKEHLIKQMSKLHLARQICEKVTPFFASREFDIRRSLEKMGYYPCKDCGVPHIKPDDKDNCLPHGTYFSEALKRYLPAGHPDWSTEEYTAASGKEWDPNAGPEGPQETAPDEGDEDDEAVH